MAQNSEMNGFQNIGLWWQQRSIGPTLFLYAELLGGGFVRSFLPLIIVVAVAIVLSPRFFLCIDSLFDVAHTQRANLEVTKSLYGVDIFHQ